MSAEDRLVLLDSGEWVFDDTLSIKAFNKHFNAELPLHHGTVVEALLQVLPSQKEMYRKWLRCWGYQFRFQRSNQLGRITVKVRLDLATLAGGVKSTYRQAREHFERSGMVIKTDYNEIIDRQAESFEASLVSTYDDHQTSYDDDLSDDDDLDDVMDIDSEFMYDPDGPVASDRMKKKRGKDILKDYQQPSYDPVMTFGDKPGPKPGG